MATCTLNIRAPSTETLTSLFSGYLEQNCRAKHGYQWNPTCQTVLINASLHDGSIISGYENSHVESQNVVYRENELHEERQRLGWPSLALQLINQAVLSHRPEDRQRKGRVMWERGGIGYRPHTSLTRCIFSSHVLQHLHHCLLISGYYLSFNHVVLCFPQSFFPLNPRIRWLFTLWLILLFWNEKKKSPLGFMSWKFHLFSHSCSLSSFYSPSINFYL